MQAALVKLALVRKLPFGPQMAEGAPLLGDLEGGGFKRHLAQALAKLLGGPPPGTPLQEEEGLPPAVSALRRALERAVSAGGAIVKQAPRPLLDKILAADGYSRPQREQILELSRVEGLRIDLAALFELAAATRLVAPEEADAPCPEAATPTPSKASRTERGRLGGILAGLGSEERLQPGAVQTQVQTAAGAGTEARPQAEATEGVPPAGAQPFEEAAEAPVATRVVVPLPAGLKAAVEQRAARAQEAGANRAQPAPGAQGRPSGEAVAAGRGGASPPGLELARAIQEFLSATLSRAAPPQRRGRAHVVEASGSPPAPPGDEGLETSGQGQPAVAEGQARRVGADPRPKAVIEQPEQPERLVVKGAGRRREAGAASEVRAAADKFSAPGPGSSSGPEPAPGPGPSPELVREVARQVERAITAGLDRGEGRLRLRLKLPELGELHLDLSLRGEHLKVVLVAESSAARDTLQAGLPELRHSLAEQGLRLEQFNVFVRHEGGFSHHPFGWGQGTEGSLAAEVSAQAAEGPETGAVLAAGRLAAGRIDLFC